MSNERSELNAHVAYLNDCTMKVNKALDELIVYLMCIVPALVGAVPSWMTWARGGTTISRLALSFSVGTLGAFFASAAIACILYIRASRLEVLAKQHLDLSRLG